MKQPKKSKKKTITVKSKNDPRYKAYQDSLKASNYSDKLKNEWTDNLFKFLNEDASNSDLKVYPSTITKKIV